MKEKIAVLIMVRRFFVSNSQKRILIVFITQGNRRGGEEKHSKPYLVSCTLTGFPLQMATIEEK